MHEQGGNLDHVTWTKYIIFYSLCLKVAHEFISNWLSSFRGNALENVDRQQMSDLWSRSLNDLDL